MNAQAPSFTHRKTCPVCASQNIERTKTSTFNFLSLDENQIKITDSGYGRIWELWKCRSCTHIFANPQPDHAFISSLYAKVEDPLYDAEAKGRRKNFLPILDFLEGLHPEKGILYDVGAATGILMAEARERGWETAGIEPSGWSVRFAKKKYGLSITEGDFLAVDISAERYTAVTMVDFIEHISEPLPAVIKARDILSPKGTLCLVTPDIESTAARITGAKWWHFRPAHLSYFSQGSIETLLERAGLEIVSIRKYAWTFSLNYLFSRLPILSLATKGSVLSSLWKKIWIKLALKDSMEIYARKVS